MESSKLKNLKNKKNKKNRLNVLVSFNTNQFRMLESFNMVSPRLHKFYENE